jgi:hypothetical protein
MNIRRLTTIVLTSLTLSTAAWAFGDKTQVDGYWRKNGTYVQPYERTLPDQRLDNNYGYPGNYNPNTDRITPMPRDGLWPTSPQPKMWGR